MCENIQTCQRFVIFPHIFFSSQLCLYCLRWHGAFILKVTSSPETITYFGRICSKPCGGAALLILSYFKRHRDLVSINYKTKTTTEGCDRRLQIISRSSILLWKVNTVAWNAFFWLTPQLPGATGAEMYSQWPLDGTICAYKETAALKLYQYLDNIMISNNFSHYIPRKGQGFGIHVFFIGNTLFFLILLYWLKHKHGLLGIKRNLRDGQVSELLSKLCQAR